MPFSGNIFTLPAGATSATPGAIVQSAVWNAIHSDIQTGMTQLMSQLTTLMTGRNLAGDNGSFEVWQRGTTVAVAASSTLYTADRWYLATGPTQACVISQATGLTNPSLFSCKVTRTAGQSGTTFVFFGYPFDIPELSYARGSILTLTFIVKAGANWSPTNGTLNYAVSVGTGTPVKLSTGYTGAVGLLAGAVNLSPGGSNTLVSANTNVVPTSTQQMEITFTWAPVGVAGADDSITIDDVQLEIDYSTVTWTPTSFDRQPFDLSLYNCKRHYKKTFAYATSPVQNAGLLNCIIAESQAIAQFGYDWRFDDNELRVSPTGSVTTYNPQGVSANWQDITAAASVAVTIDTTSVSNSSKHIYLQGASAQAPGHQIAIHVTASAGI